MKTAIIVKSYLGLVCAPTGHERPPKYNTRYGLFNEIASVNMRKVINPAIITACHIGTIALNDFIRLIAKLIINLI